MAEKRERRTAIVTGGTTGIGLHLSVGLARAGYRVVMLGRREDHARAALATVQENVPDAKARYLLADLSDLREVERVGKQLRREHAAIHILINNVGAFYLSRQETPQGIEKTFALNHLSHFYLTHLLLDRLIAADDARLIETSSGAHHSPRDADVDWQLRRGYMGWRAYGISKLANILFANELARRFAAADLAINSFHPGFVQTQLATRNPLLRPFVKLAYLFMGGSAEEGADTGLYLALDDSIQGSSGNYYVDRQIVRPSRLARDGELAEKLWDLSLDLTGVRKFGVMD